MKTIAYILIALILFTAFYTFVIFKFDIGVPSYDDYKNNPPCEFKQVEDGYTQLDNCAVYKLDYSKFGWGLSRR